MRLLLIVAALCLSMLGLLAAPVPTGKPSNYPAWWFAREVIQRTDTNVTNPAWPTNYPTSDDYAVINQGQLKNFATQAYAELQAQAPSSVWSTSQGTALTSLVTGWNPSSGDAYAVVNLGQLKTVAKPFYDVLIQIGYTSFYPWTGVGADDYAVANIGQSKLVFDFDLTVTPPQIPASLTVVLSSTSATLIWTDSSSVQNYYVQESTDGGTTWTTVATVSGSTTSDTLGIPLGASYSFRVIAAGQANSSSQPSTNDAAPVITLNTPSGATLVP